MKQATCFRDIFYAPKDGEIVCVGATSRDIGAGKKCKIECRASRPEPAEITCDGLNGWSHQEASCDATNGGLPPGAQIALIIVALAILCAGTFAWQKYYRKTDSTPKHEVKYAGQVTAYDPSRTHGMGRDGFDNLQTVSLGECTPLPQPKNRPSGGYHPAGAGIHDFMGTCTIGTVSQNPKLGEFKEDPRNLA